MLRNIQDRLVFSVLAVIKFQNFAYTFELFKFIAKPNRGTLCKLEVCRNAEQLGLTVREEI